MTTSEDADPITLDELLQFHIDIVDEEAESFPGDLPEQGVSAILRAAVGFDGILKRTEIYRANDEIEEGPTDERVASALETQCIDLLAAIANLKREYDLDIEGAFKRRRAQTQAMRAAESMEELQDALDEAGIEMDVVNGDGIKPGDNVDMDDYEPAERDGGTY